MERREVKKKKVVLASGTFDLIHYGHVRYLEEAKKIGGKNTELIVIVARDNTVKRRKGKKPVMPEHQRRSLVEALRVVDKAILGFEEELIAPESEIWNCTNCYTCSERCPQDVRPVDVIIALKNLCIAEGKAPDIVLTVSDAVLAAGITTKVTALIERRRKELGLSPIKEYPLDDLKKITGKD